MVRHRCARHSGYPRTVQINACYFAHSGFELCPFLWVFDFHKWNNVEATVSMCPAIVAKSLWLLITSRILGKIQANSFGGTIRSVHKWSRVFVLQSYCEASRNFLSHNPKLYFWLREVVFHSHKEYGLSARRVQPLSLLLAFLPVNSPTNEFEPYVALSHAIKRQPSRLNS